VVKKCIPIINYYVKSRTLFFMLKKKKFKLVFSLLGTSSAGFVVR